MMCRAVALISGLATLLATLFLLAPAPAAAGTQEEYDECIASCAAKFERVEEADGSCEQTLVKMHHDLNLILNLLSRADLCRGRSAGACKEFIEYARPALEKVVAHLLDVQSCADVDAKALQDELWLFDTAKACKGDGTFTDLHDFLVAKKDHLDSLNMTGTSYQFDRRMFDAYDDFHGHRPECEGGARPSLSYVYPLFQFYLALDSLMAWQACMPSCRAPTEAEKRLWAVSETVGKLRAQADFLSEALQKHSAEREQQLVARFGVTFPCRPVSDELVALKAHKEVLSRMEAALKDLQLVPNESVGKLDALERESNQLAEVIKASAIESLLAACAAEDELAEKLLQRKRNVVDTVLRGETFCIEAAHVFVGEGERGAACDWIGDCNMPLRCEKGKCAGKVSVSEVRKVLDGAKALADGGLQLKLHDSQGLDTRAQRQLHDLEKDVQKAEAELLEHDWQNAVKQWRETYRKELPARLQELAGALEEHRTAAEDETLAKACRRAHDRVAGRAKDLDLLQGALGDPDPVSRAKWVRLKSRDAAALRAEIAELEAKVEERCTPAEEEGGGWVLYAIAGAAALLVLLIVGFVLWRRKRR